METSPSTLTKNEAREKAKTDPIFLAELLGYDMEEVPHGEFFEKLSSAKPKKLCLWPRGHFKTSCVVVEIVRRILNDPDVRILIMQATLKLTKGLLSEIKSHFNGYNHRSRLKELFPQFCAPRMGDNLHILIPCRKRSHLKEATVTAASPKAVQTSQHYNVMFFDDLVNTENFRNVELLDKLESQFSHFLPLLDPGGEVIVTGTRYSHADLYARIMEKDKERREWELTVRECYLPNGELLFPERSTKDGRKIGFTAELLAQLQRDDAEMFVPQYLNRIMVGKNQLFPQQLLLDSVRQTKEADFPAPIIFAIDLAESKNVYSDHSVVAVGKQDRSGCLWLLDAVGNTWSPMELATVVINLALKYRPQRILFEKCSGAETMKELIRVIATEKGINLPLEVMKAAKRNKDSKYFRIAGLSREFHSKKLLLCTGITCFDLLTKQFEQFPMGRHDDYPDAVGLLRAFYMENTGTKPIQPPQQLPWFVNRIIQDDAPSPTKITSMCGDGFLG